jgi:hypothetical protein
MTEEVITGRYHSYDARKGPGPRPAQAAGRRLPIQGLRHKQQQLADRRVNQG